MDASGQTRQEFRPVAMTTVTLAAGDALTFANGEDLALILRGRIACYGVAEQVPSQAVLGWDVPTIVAASDCRVMGIVALSDVQVVRMTLATCQSLVATSDRFRALYEQAMTARHAALRRCGQGTGDGAPPRSRAGGRSAARSRTGPAPVR